MFRAGCFNISLSHCLDGFSVRDILLEKSPLPEIQTVTRNVIRGILRKNGT